MGKQLFSDLGVTVQLCIQVVVGVCQNWLEKKKKITKPNKTHRECSKGLLVDVCRKGREGCKAAYEGRAALDKTHTTGVCGPAAEAGKILRAW